MASEQASEVGDVTFEGGREQRFSSLLVCSVATAHSTQKNLFGTRGLDKRLLASVLAQRFDTLATTRRIRHTPRDSCFYQRRKRRDEASSYHQSTAVLSPRVGRLHSTAQHSTPNRTRVRHDTS